MTCYIMIHLLKKGEQEKAQGFPSRIKLVSLTSSFFFFGGGGGGAFGIVSPRGIYRYSTTSPYRAHPLTSLMPERTGALYLPIVLAA